MIVDSTRFDLSLNDTSNLRNLIIENPELPLIIFAGDEAWSGDASYTMADISSGSVELITLHDDCWFDEDDFREHLIDAMCDEEWARNLTDEEFYAIVDEEIDKTEFIKVIVVYVG